MEIIALWDRYDMVICVFVCVFVFVFQPVIFQVQFRADPVLYKDNLPASMKKFNDMGSLWYHFWVVNKSGAEEVHLVQQYSIYWPCDCAI